MQLKSGRIISADFLNNVLDAAILEYAGTGFEESIGDVYDVTAQSLQEDLWINDKENLTFEEAEEVWEIILPMYKQFADELLKKYAELGEKYKFTDEQ